MRRRRAQLEGLRHILRADFARQLNETRAQYLALIIIRLGQHVQAHGLGGLPRLIWRMADIVYLRVVMGAEFPPTARIGPGLALPHAGRGVSITRDAVIGSDCLLFSFVTIGQGTGGSPRLEDGVMVGTGARIIGPVTVGCKAHVGANSVVIRDVPPGATAFGVPARILRDQASSPDASSG